VRIYKVNNNPETAAKELPNFYLFESLDCAAAVLSQVLTDEIKSRFIIPNEKIFLSREFKLALKYRKTYNWILDFALYGCQEVRNRIKGYKYKYEDVIIYLKDNLNYEFEDKIKKEIDFWPPKRYCKILKRVCKDSNSTTQLFLCVYHFKRCFWNNMEDVPDWAEKNFTKLRSKTKYEWGKYSRFHFSEKALDILPKKYENRIVKE